MFGPKIWDFYAGWYDKLWVQKFVLTPSRQLIMKTINGLTIPEDILDVGCGIGELCHDISHQYPTVNITGIDPSSKMIQRSKSLHFANNINFICGHIEDLPTEKKFDLIISTHAFPYIKDKSKFLNEVKKRLNTDGRILLLFANRNNWYDAFWLRLVKLTTSEAQYLSVNDTKILLKSAGFEVGKTERIQSVYIVPSVYLIEGVHRI